MVNAKPVMNTVTVKLTGQLGEQSKDVFCREEAASLKLPAHATRMIATAS